MPDCIHLLTPATCALCLGSRDDTQPRRYVPADWVTVDWANFAELGAARPAVTSAPCDHVLPPEAEDDGLWGDYRTDLDLAIELGAVDVTVLPPVGRPDWLPTAFSKWSPGERLVALLPDDHYDSGRLDPRSADFDSDDESSFVEADDPEGEEA